MRSLSLLFFNNTFAEERESELNNLFKQLKKSDIASTIEIENKIWKIYMDQITSNVHKIYLWKIWKRYNNPIPVYGSGCFRGLGHDGMIEKAEKFVK